MVAGTVEFARQGPLMRAVLAAPSGLAALEAYLHDTSAVRPDVQWAAVERALVVEFRSPEEEPMTTFIEWQQQQRAEGRAEGRTERGAELLLKQLRLRFGALSAEVEARVRSASPADHDRWAERILTAPTLAEVFVE
jgi:hypothetical protein